MEAVNAHVAPLDQCTQTNAKARTFAVEVLRSVLKHVRRPRKSKNHKTNAHTEMRKTFFVLFLAEATTTLLRKITEQLFAIQLEENSLNVK